MRETAAILYNIRSVHNVASIFRTADGAGVNELVLCGITPSPLDRFGRVRRDFQKVSLGAEMTVPWRYARSARAAVRALKARGFRVYAVECTEGAVPYDRIRRRDLGDKCALVFGNEVKGIPGALIADADGTLMIPMRGEKESLNVGVAFGIAAYGIFRPGNQL